MSTIVDRYRVARMFTPPHEVWHMVFDHEKLKGLLDAPRLPVRQERGAYSRRHE